MPDTIWVRRSRLPKSNSRDDDSDIDQDIDVIFVA